MSKTPNTEILPIDSQEDLSTNPSGNRHFRDVLQANLSRRTVVKGTLASAAATAFLSPAAALADHDHRKYRRRRKLVNFRPVSIAQGSADNTMPTISEDYEYQVLIPWGTPIEPGATEEYTGDPDTRPTSKQARQQIGIGHDGMFFYPESTRNGRRKSSSKGMLCINHEFGTNPHVLGKSFPEDIEDVRLSQHVHGVSVVALEKKRRGRWEVVSSPNSRRIHVNTPVEFSGPAAGSDLLENMAGNVPLGTVNNCGSGPTPWGTYLTCEENFNGYFGWTDPAYIPTEPQNRYGFGENGFGYGWHVFDARFDISNPEFSNESNRFGWVVEIDPYDGTQKPVKRTALGRFKHEAIAIAETRGRGSRIAAYMGDDQRFDYC